MTTREHPEDRKARVSEVFSEYVAAGGAFAGPAWVSGVPMAIVASVYAFLLVACVSTVLFDQLSGMRRLPHGPLRKTTGVVRSLTFGATIGVASAYAEEYVHYFSLASAALAGVCIPLVGAAWRQRWSERQLYRDTLLPPPGQPGTLPAVTAYGPDTSTQ